MFKGDMTNKKEMQQYLYIRGFLITDDKNIDIEKYPFYGNWNANRIGCYSLYINNFQRLYTYECSNKVYFIIGHAYNPFTGEYKEDKILSYIAQSDINDTYYKAVSELTGTFMAGYVQDDKDIYFYGDAACMMSTFYGVYKENVYISSHTQLIGDICGIEVDPFIRELLEYKYYNLFGRCLPGDLSPYKPFKRVVPNFEYTYSDKLFSWKRFYLKEKINIVSSDEDY